MFRLILGALLGLILALPAAVRAQSLPDAAPFVRAPDFVPVGPVTARGALVWLHGAYDSRAMAPPPAPDWVARMAQRQIDIWRYNRVSGQDGLGAGAAGLGRGLKGLPAAGYRRIVVAGFSRGGWIALTAAHHAGLADAVVAFSPGAHGTSADQKGEALAAWATLWRDAVPGAPRVVLVQLRDDPFDPDPKRRHEIARAASLRVNFRLLPIFLPDRPTGHLGSYDQGFDARFGEAIATFVDPTRERPGG